MMETAIPFCYYIQQDEQKRCATKYISRKPGEQNEVDRAAVLGVIIDPDIGEKRSNSWRDSQSLKSSAIYGYNTWNRGRIFDFHIPIFCQGCSNILFICTI